MMTNNKAICNANVAATARLQIFYFFPSKPLLEYVYGIKLTISHASGESLLESRHLEI